MARPDGAHGVLGDVPFKLDQSAPEEIQRPAYRHFFRPLFRQGIDITGRPGAQNLREDRLVWHITDWGGGEGQVVLRNNDDGSARRFHRAEGLDFKVPGQVQLNRSIQINSPADATGGASATSEGSAWTDVTGTSTVVNTTDRRLNAVADVVESQTHTPGAGQVQVKFHVYKEAVQETTVQGTSFSRIAGSTSTSGTDIILRSGGTRVQTATLTAGTDFTADVPVTVKFFLYDATAGRHFIFPVARCRIMRNAQGGSQFDDIITSQVVTVKNTSSDDANATVTFTPRGTNTYRIELASGNDFLLALDKVTYSALTEPTSVSLKVRNHSAGTTIATKTLQLANDTSDAVWTMNYNAAAATNYRYRVEYNSGSQRPVVDKTVATVNTTASAPWEHEAMELGIDGKIWLVSNRSGVDSIAFTYDFANEDWDVANTALSDGANDDVCRSLTHSASYMYAALASGVIIKFDETDDWDYNAPIADLIGIAICQDRLFALSEGNDASSQNVTIRTFAVDADVSAGVTSVLQTATVATGIQTNDPTLREQIVGTPTGARFFANFADVTSVIYEADASGSALVVKELCRLDKGAKATAIDHVAGLTFVAAQFMAETGSVARSALYVIDQGNTPRRIGYFRRDDPIDAPVVSMQPYENDLWLLQGHHVWRYSLQTGGLFCEYELDPGDMDFARQLAVVQDHIFVAYNREDSTNTGGSVWVAGTVDTYRQASVTDGSMFTTSVYDYGLPGEHKMLRTIRVVTDSLPDNTSVTIEAQLDQDGTWRSIGTHSVGSETVLGVSPEETIEFRTLQLRVTLNSATGANTPVVKAVIAEALCLEFEEFFELAILTEAEDSSFHVADTTRTGGDIAQAINSLRRSRTPFTYQDAFEHPSLENNPEYLVVFDTSDGSNDEVAEGRMLVRLRVL